jgi:AcrR family transcriptional regulator
MRLMPEALRAAVPEDALTVARRRQIFLAACRVLALKSFHQATVKEIALEAKLAAGSIYVYFQTKDDILLLLAESMVGELAEALPAIREHSGGDPRRELLGIMRRVLDIIDRYREAFAALNHEVRYLERNPRYRDDLRRIIAPYRGALRDALERGKAAGTLSFDSVNSAVEAMHMLCSGWARGGSLLAHTGKETYWREIAGIVEGRFFAGSGGNS